MTSNITITDKQGTGTTITIGQSKVEEDFTDAPIIIQIPTVTGNKGDTRVKTINRVKHLLTINGMLDTAIATSASVTTERTNLRTMQVRTGNDKFVTTNYITTRYATTGDGSPTWQIIKCKISEDSTDEATLRQLPIMIQLLEANPL